MGVRVAADAVAGAVTNATIFSVEAGSRIVPKFIHMSMDTGAATMYIGSVPIAATSGELNIDLFGKRMNLGALGDDLLLTSSGAMSYTVLYETEAD